MPEAELYQNARELIALESITGNEEPVAAYLERALGGMGLAVKTQPVAPGRRNLLAGPPRPAVLFCTHMDTVPPYVPLQEDAEFLRGRGACDTKGIIASMLEAGRTLLADGRRDFGFLFLVGEEVDHVGARTANGLARARHVIVGEPTELKVAVGHKGIIGAHVTATGTPCHSAYPEEGDSAVHRLVAGIARVLAADFGRSEVLGPSTVNVGAIEGGVAPNVLAPSAHATILVRVAADLEAAERTLGACFADPRTGHPDPRIQIEPYLRVGPPRLERVEGYPETVVSYGTDVPFLSDVGKAILFGPGSIRDAHTVGEKVAKRDLVRAAEAYVDMAKRLMDAG
jgi:acetylornithine deacetylase